jgi:segregation and condensation protein A
MQTYNIKIDKFEGPFDLLLFFIERDELDIYDIPISQITNDFLAYIKELQNLNIDVASEFILVAATLMNIKAKMLLPRKELDEFGNEIDPRKELVHQLLEYAKYKSVIAELSEMEDNRHKRHGRGNIGAEFERLAETVSYESEIESITLYKLLTVFNRLMAALDKNKNQVVHRIYNYNYSIADQQKFIIDHLNFDKEIKFESLFDHIENRVHAIVTFLALLELLNTHQVTVVQGNGPNNFWICRRDVKPEEEE